MTFVGKLPLPPESNEIGRDATVNVFIVDPTTQRMYMKFSGGTNIFLREYDLRPRVPRPIRQARIANSSEIGLFFPFTTNNTAFDTRRDRILFMGVAAGGLAACEDDPLCTSGSGAPAVVKLFDIDRKTLRRSAVYNLNIAIPGFTPQGMTYSPDDDVVYFVGDMNPAGAINPNDFFQGDNPRTFPVAIAAVDAKTMSLRWVRPVHECPALMTTQFLGAGVFRSKHLPALYWTCIQTGGSNVPPYPEPSGVMRLLIDPEATQTEALSFPVQFFPISGSYATGGGVSGVATFDYASDRLFMQSQASRLPGLWVFDGRLSAWVGFVGTPDASIGFAGVNQIRGRHYIGGTSYIIPVDGRLTPVPQGTIEPIPSVQGQIITDGPTGRLFFPSQNKQHKIEWLVYDDDTPVRKLPQPLGYDSLTTDLPEGKDTISTFSGTLSGFGTQLILAGGTGAILDPYCVDVSDFGCSSVRQTLKDVFNLSPSSGPRAIFAARVPEIDVRNVGASAAARALSPDPVTEGEYETVVDVIATQNGAGDEEKEPGKTLAQSLAWPHKSLFCLDSEGEEKHEEMAGNGGSADVKCDLGGPRASATTGYKAIAAEGLSVGSSSYRGQVSRDPKLGIVTEAWATAEHVVIGATGVGSVTIARVVTHARTQAHGHPGTATAAWARTLEGVVVKNAAGDTVFECSNGKDCDPDDAIRSMNDVLQSKIHVFLPEAEVEATPGGAFASVQENAGDYYNGLVTNDDDGRAVPGLQIVVYNDTQQKSRAVMQLAAIQASSIYGISQLPGIGPIEPGGLPPILPTIGPVAPPPVDFGDGGILPLPTNPTRRLGRSALFLIRSPKDALLFGMTILMLAGAVAAAWRRRVLMSELAKET